MTDTKAITTVQQDKPRQSAGIFDRMCARYGIRNPAVLCVTLREQWTPDVSSKISDNQIGAFLVVADQYGLNPLTKEIYAFPSKGGAIVPMLGIDGWITIANNHKDYDNCEFKDIPGADGKLHAIECIIYRKDRTRPTTVREYLTECKRDTIPWKQSPARMLRHRAFMQCARYAFGFTGLAMEGDEIDGEVLTLSSAPIPNDTEAMPTRRMSARETAIMEEDRQIRESADRAAAARFQEAELEAQQQQGGYDVDSVDSSESAAGGDHDSTDEHSDDHDEADDLPDPRIDVAAGIAAKLRAQTTVIDLNAAWSSNKAHIETLPDDLKAMLEAAKSERMKQLKGSPK